MAPSTPAPAATSAPPPAATSQVPTPATRPAPAPAEPAPVVTAPNVKQNPPGKGPAPTVTVPAGAAATATDPRSGVDWEKFWRENDLNIVRSGLELGRLYPGWGLLLGGAADVINGYQDVTQIEGEDAPIIKGLLIARTMALMVNNGLGHLAYVNQLVQDGATVSVVFVEFTPVTATANELIKLAKVTLDAEMLLLDFGLSCAALYKQSQAPPGSASAKKWEGMAANYVANVVGGFIGGIIDVIDLASGGFTNAEVIKQGGNFLRNVMNIATRMWPLMRGYLLSLWGVWGGKAFESDEKPAAGAAPTSGPALARAVASSLGDRAAGLGRQAAAELILLELQNMKAGYELGDTLLGVGADMAAERIAQMQALAMEITGGKDPFVMARDAATEGLDSMEGRLGQITQLAAMSGSAEEKAQGVVEFCDEMLGKLDAFRVPDVRIPEADVGDGLLADAAEGVLNFGGDIANAGLEFIIEQINEVVGLAKAALRVPLETVKDNAVEVGEFMHIVVEQGAEQIATGQKMVADFRKKLAKCQNVEDVIELIVNQVFELVGIESQFEIDDVRTAWRDIGVMIDDGIQWAQDLRDNPEGAEAPTDSAAKAQAPPADPAGATPRSRPAPAPA